MTTPGVNRTVSSIIDEFGGATAFGRLINVGASTASEMKRRNSIPVRYWPAVIEAARRSEWSLSEADLVAAHIEAERAKGRDIPEMSSPPFPAPGGVAEPEKAAS